MTTTIALAGKGGTGKTTLAALLIRHFVQNRLGSVLAIDADPSSNLHLALGLPLTQTVGDIREDARDQTPPGMSRQDWLDYAVRMAVEEGRGFDLLAMGRPEGPGCYCAANHMLRTIVDGICKSYDFVVMDNEAGMEYLSRRMGRNKALLDLDGCPMIAVIAGRLRTLADEVIISADDTQLYAPFADRCVADIFTGVGTLGGIHSGLQAAANDLAIVAGCDMPFLNPNVLAWFVAVAEGVDAVVLKQGEWLEPLHAVYRKSCLPAIEAAIRAGQRQAFCFYPQVRVRYVSPSEIAHLDPDLRSFRNVNTPEE